MAKLSRRQLGLGTMAAAAMAQSSSAQYTGPLDGVEGKVKSADFDPVLWTQKRYESAPLKLTFKAETRKQAEAWQRQLRSKIVELIGGFPAKRTRLNPQVLETRDFPGYTRQKVVFESRPDMMVLAYVLRPKTGKPKYPVMICIPGHGRGVDGLVGIDEKGHDRTQKQGYEYDFAIQAVEHGFAAVAIEPMAFGCRRDVKTKAHGLTASACQPAAGAALLFGETMIGWRVWDVMRTVDYIETRPDLDDTRVACVGVSGGGTCTTFATALDPRIKLAFVSSYINTFRDSILSISHCIDNYVPGILNWAELYDVAGLIAPRPMFVESGDLDTIFPVEASRASFEKIKKVYEAFDATDVIEQEVFHGPHSFHGGRGFPFAAKHLDA